MNSETKKVGQNHIQSFTIKNFGTWSFIFPEIINYSYTQKKVCKTHFSFSFKKSGRKVEFENRLGETEIFTCFYVPAIDRS